MPADLPLLTRYPALAPRLPRVALCELPTPVTPLAALGSDLGTASLHAKRDDLSAPDYGGNKVRKLEFLLADATRRQRREILTFGFAGSNFAAATALYGQRHGLHCISMLLPQRPSDYVRHNLLLGRAAGASLYHAGSVPVLALKALWQSARRPLTGRRLPYWIPAGGSSPIGVCAYVNAGLELAGQVAAGALPAPDRIYVAMGSMGTAAGLAIGLELAGLPTRVEAVRVVEKRFASARLLEDLVGQVARFLGPGVLPAARVPAVCQRLTVREEYFGGEYGYVAPPVRAAMERFAAGSGLQLDGTYSGKAVAALVEDAGKGLLGARHVLFWHTFNGRPLGPLIGATKAAEIPAALGGYFS